MFQRFYPDHYVESAYDIPYEELYRQGVRGLLYDIDNTLVEHDQDATERAVELMDRLKKLGFSVTLLSNNDEERVKRFNRDIQVNYIHKAGKPSTRSYLRAMEQMHTDTASTVFIGDQLFTDIWGAKRAGIPAWLVKPIAKHEEIQIVLKRKLEKLVLYFYRRDEKRKTMGQRNKQSEG